MTEPIFDHERLDVYRLAIDILAINGYVLHNRSR